MLVLLAVACGIDLPSEEILDRTRILAARAEPAQPAVGETFSVVSYAFAPTGPPTVVWCLPGSDCDPRGPLVAELAALDWATLDDAERATRRTEALQEGIVGVEPGLPVEAPAVPVPPVGDIQLLAFGVPPEGDDVEQATLTLTPAGEVPNQHPTLEAVQLDGQEVTEIVIGVDETVTLDVVLADDALEDYVDEDGEQLVELASVFWYTDAPEPDEMSFGGGGPAAFDDGSTELTVGEPFSGIVVVVVRDGRGGADWRELSLTVE